MKYIAIILIAVLLVLLVLFVSWFLNMKANGKCPICALKKVFIPTSLTIDIGEVEDYSNEVAKTPPMGWSSWNTFRNNIDQDIIMQTAHAMKDSGLANAGYEFINLDDCWQALFVTATVNCRVTSALSAAVYLILLKILTLWA